MPAAYNASIYLMVGMPYTVLTILGLLVYRGCKKNAAYLQHVTKAGEPDDGSSFPADRAGNEPSA